MKRAAQVFCATVVLLSALVARSIYVQHSLDCELIAAAKRLDAPAVKTCLAAGANPNASDSETGQPLWIRVLAYLCGQHLAADDGDAVLLVVLNRSVERENAQSANRTTGANASSSFEPTEIVSALLDKGVNANAQMAYGESAISFVLGSGYKQCVRTLLEHGARANGVASVGGTLLTYAISGDDFDTVSELIEHGANVNATYQQIARNCPSEAAVVSELIKQGVPVNVTVTSGANPLAYAMSSASANDPVRQRIIQLLIKSGAYQ